MVTKIKTAEESALDEKIAEIGKDIKEKSLAVKAAMEALEDARLNFYRLMYENNKYYKQKNENITAYIKVRKFLDNTLYCDIAAKSKIGNSIGTAEFKVFDPTVKTFEVISEAEYEKGDAEILNGLELKRTAGIILLNQ